MTQWICSTCAVEYPDTEAPPALCAICTDERQFVPRTGQAWTSLEEMSDSGFRLEVHEVEPDLYGIRSAPPIGLGQQALLLCTEVGNLLWDPTGFVDEASAQQVRDLGGASIIVASHPHMYGAQVAWSRALGDVPVMVAEADRAWVQRPDPSIIHFTGNLEVLPGVTISTVGGHFPGSLVARWARGASGRGVVLAGDTIFPGPDGNWVTFMRSFANTIPLSAAVVDRVANAVNRVPFDRLYGNFGGVIPANASEVVRRSADRYMGWVRGDFDHLT